MTTVAPLPEDDARRLWSGSRPERAEHFFTTVATTGTVWAWDFGTGLLEIDDQDNLLVPLWSHPRLAAMTADAIGFEDVGPAAPVDVDVLLDELFEDFHREGHEIAVLPTDGRFTTVLSLERFRVEVLEARLRVAGLIDEAARARRDEFYEDRKRRADHRLALDPADRAAVASHLRERLTAAECAHSPAFPVTRRWFDSRGPSWDVLARSLKVLCSCDCEARDHFGAAAPTR